VQSLLAAERYVWLFHAAFNAHEIQVYAAGSEDMDTLTFSAPILFRHLTFSEAKKQPISEINLQAALDGLDMGMSQVSTLPMVSLHALTLFAVH
jgi:hypothetical protein